MEAGTRAFVSYVRGYKEHHCKFIFRIQVGRHPERFKSHRCRLQVRRELGRNLGLMERQGQGTEGSR